ncbi:Hypothetical protein NTJ_03016 [Nesidiocoris tenuis]|uniref:Uncharacterized protein n=1 Tax=Nesidiocoris tenuis TaxID=355587 RepID=A0ABN7AD27_9HEMI|nr:Hypothetical protein NTJ_03016 [Nesidiocoris tenuis]
MTSLQLTGFSALILMITAPSVFGALDTRLHNQSLRPEAGKYSVEEKHSEPEGVDGRDPQARLGFISYGTDTSGYQTTASVTPLKIELGGVFLGTLIGLGFVLLAPKVSELFNHGHHQSAGQYSPHGSWSRSEDQNMMNGLSKIISRVDETLQENNIDSMSCLERAACFYVQSSGGSSGQIASTLLSSNSSFSILNFMIDGSRLKAALDRGINGENCSAVYSQCSFSKNTLVSGIRSLMVGNAL